MARHIGTKLLDARPMTRQEYVNYRGWPLPADENGDDAGYLVEYLDGGQANHPAHAGYISWSPADVFDKAYRPVTGMSFGHAIEAMKAGQRVARAGWNGNLPSAFVPQTREPVVLGSLCYILLDTGDVAICDAEDLDLVRLPRTAGDGFKEWYIDGGGYPAVSLYQGGDQNNVRLHQLIAGPFSDHANGDRLDNRRRNLRAASASENNANRRSVQGSSSEFKGVTWDKSRNRWMAAINSRTLGRFEDETDAARAYDKAAKEVYGRFARLNFPEPRMWIALGGGNPATPAASFWNLHTAAFAVANGGTAPVLPYILMKTAGDEILMGWLASQTDMLADDWQVVT